MNLYKHAADSLKTFLFTLFRSKRRPHFLINTVTFPICGRAAFRSAAALHPALFFAGKPGIALIDFFYIIVQQNDLTLVGNCHHALLSGRTACELGCLSGAFGRISEINMDSFLPLYIIRSRSRSNVGSIPLVAQRERLFREEVYLRVNVWNFFSCAEDRRPVLTSPIRSPAAAVSPP